MIPRIFSNSALRLIFLALSLTAALASPASAEPPESERDRLDASMDLQEENITPAAATVAGTAIAAKAFQRSNQQDKLRRKFQTAPDQALLRLDRRDAHAYLAAERDLVRAQGQHSRASRETFRNPIRSAPARASTPSFLSVYSNNSDGSISCKNYEPREFGRGSTLTKAEAELIDQELGQARRRYEATGAAVRQAERKLKSARAQLLLTLRGNPRFRDLKEIDKALISKRLADLAASRRDVATLCGFGAVALALGGTYDLGKRFLALRDASDPEAQAATEGGAFGGKVLTDPRRENSKKLSHEEFPHLLKGQELLLPQNSAH